MFWTKEQRSQLKGTNTFQLATVLSQQVQSDYLELRTLPTTPSVNAPKEIAYDVQVERDSYITGLGRRSRSSVGVLDSHTISLWNVDKGGSLLGRFVQFFLFNQMFCFFSFSFLATTE